ncbi:MAG TPA: DUF4159 domain-containing protein, partial [Rhodospirillales bacterium]|nr:DUF4159 domain-containing protein [Rhodospirillales bacterium]
MLSLGPLAFAQPWLLLALAALPAIWWLLRATPPAPRRVVFPPFLLLARLASSERTPARTPWWLLLLRLVVAALLVLAMAGPVLDPRPRLAADRPLLIVLDDGWAAAPGWKRRIDTLRDLLARAQRENLSAYLLRTAPDREGPVLLADDPGRLARRVADFAPRPWPVRHDLAREALGRLEAPAFTVFWLADGIVSDREGETAAAEFARALRRLGPLTVFADPPADRARLLREPTTEGDGLALELVRPTPGPAETVPVAAHGPGGEILARTELVFAEGERIGRGRITLPLELRNRIARLATAAPGAGTVVLFDERWRRRMVGLTGAERDPEAQPLLSELYFVSRALAPYAELREGRIADLVRSRLSMIVLADVGRLTEDERTALEDWIRRGGVLLRFAGPRLAAGGDGLLPVRLRQGDRILGGAMSWSKPLPFAPFPDEGPFAGLETTPEALVYRQVLAEPGPELASATLATLEDGTPIITGRRMGEGWLLLVHTTANTSWTSLPLSRLFIDIMRRTLALAPGVGGRPEGMLRASRVLDGFGRLGAPPPDLLPLSAAALATAEPGPDTPPGLWAPVAAATDSDRTAGVALNLQKAVTDSRALDLGELVPEVRAYERSRETPLAPWLLTAALLLALADLAIALALRGLLRPVAATLLLGALAAVPADAAEDDATLAQLLAQTRLAYVRTGLPEVDRLSAAGLEGLGFVLARRTSVEPADPVGVDPATDELALYPLLYWPVPPEHPDLPPGTLARVDRYLKNGGMILFDTGDAGRLLPGQSGGPGEQRLAQLLEGLDLPPLVPVPENHALTRSFYLLREF